MRRYQGQVASRLWRFTRDKACCEELVQDVFVEAYFSLGTFRGEAPFVHWLRRIATRVGYRHWRRQARERARPHVPLEDWDQLPAAAGSELDPSQAAALLHALLGQLPPRDRLVLTLRYFEGCDTRETASLTGWSVAMVKVQAHRARQKLKRLVEKDKLAEKLGWTP